MREIESMHNVKPEMSNWQKGKFLATQSEHHSNTNGKKILLKRPKLIDYGNVSEASDTEYELSVETVAKKSKFVKTKHTKPKASAKDDSDDEENRTCCASCSTIVQYLSSEMTKQPTTFKIGIFTVFIVVMFITMLQSVVDSAPILFVKIGQDEAGAFDVTIRRRLPDVMP